MRNDAVSVFDFDVDTNSLFPIHQRLEKTFSYDMHWWQYLNLQSAYVIIILSAETRDSFVKNPEGKGQFIRGTEFCHKGDISVRLFSRYLFVQGNLYETGGYQIKEYELDQVKNLVAEILSWSDQ